MILLKQIDLTYKKPLFQHFNLELPLNRWTTLLGPSGIGKSTLLRLIAGLETADSGEVICDMPISYLSQADSLLPWKTAIKNVSPLQHTIPKEAKQSLKEVGLAEHQYKYPHELSGGMRQRVALARILTEDRPLVLLDEPFSALDAITRFDLQNLAHNAFKSKTIIMVTHDPLEALRLSDQIIVLHNTPVRYSEPLHLTQAAPRELDTDEVRSHYSVLMKQLQQAKASA